MGETFYTALDVSPDAEPAAIRRAYRDLAKTHHPDVSDDPAASETFKRLTTARDVLVDPDERERYDRLGHDAYVSRHLSGNGWTGLDAAGRAEAGPGAEPAGTRSATGGSTTGATTAGTGRRTTAGDDRSASGGSERAWWTEREAGSRADRRGPESDDQTRSGQWSGDDQPSADYYRTTVGATTGSASPGLLARLRGFGPWLGVHALLFLSALATSWFLAGMIIASPAAPVGAVLLVLLLPVASACLSFVHLAAIA